MQLELGTPSFTLVDGSTSWNTAAAPALDMWNQVMLRLQLGRVADSKAPVSSGDGINSMTFASTVFGQSFGSSTLAVTYYRYSGSTMLEADILFNSAKTFNSYRGPLQSIGYDIQRVAVHELGHVLGLAHPDQAGQTVDAIMNSHISDRYTLSADDIAGAQSLYGAASPTPTPTPTPVPTPVMSLAVSPLSVSTGGTAIFTVRASIVPTSAITVYYAMSGSAVLGTSYSLSGTAGQVKIAAGARSANVILTVLKTGVQTRTATMTLTSGAGYSLSSSNTATVSIGP